MRVIIVFLLYFLGTSECARILGMFHLAGRSHFEAGSTLMRILADHGHDVTMISPFSVKNPPKKLRNIVLAQDEKERPNFFNFNVHHFLQSYIYSTMSLDMIDSTFGHPEFQKFIKQNEKFDLVILEAFYSDALKYLAVHFDAPLLIYSALDASSWTNPSFGNPSPPSYIPDKISPFTTEMTFFQRMDNMGMYIVNELILKFIQLPKHDEIVKKYFPGAPDISEYFHKASVVLLNSDYSTDDPVPKVPGMIDIGGFHINPPKELPKDLQKLLDNAKHGVIYFSLGSNIKSTDMPKETLKALIRVFSKLKETILWKWEDDNLPGKPSNVVTRKWLPQNDIFAHKNVKLFITHGGIFSTMEAVHHRIPCLALPVFGDQMMNAKKSTNHGYARVIPFREITEEKLQENIDEMLNNPKYLQIVKKRSSIMHDKLISPREKLVYWVEYVIRHNGADHLRVAALKLNWYQYLLLDVIAFILISLILLLYAVKFFMKFLKNAFKNKPAKTKKH